MNKNHLLSILLFVLTTVSFSQDPPDTIWTRQFFQIQDARISPDGSKVIVATREDGVYILEAETGEELYQYESDDRIENIAVSSNSQYVYASDLKRRNLLEFGDETEYNHQGVVLPNDMAIDEFRNRIIYSTCLQSGENERIRIFDIETLSLSEDIPSDYCLDQIRLSPDGNYIALTAKDKSNIDFTTYLLLLYDSDFSLLHTVYSDTSISVPDVEFTSNSKTIYFTAGDIYRFDILEQELSKLTNGYGYSSFELSKDDRWLISNYYFDYSLKIMDLNDYEFIYNSNLLTGNIWDVNSNGDFISGNANNLHMMSLPKLLSVDESISERMSYSIINNQLRFNFSENTGQWNIMISDLLGNVILEDQMNNSETLSFNLNDINSKLIIVQLENNGESIVLKMILGE